MNARLEEGVPASGGCPIHDTPPEGGRLGPEDELVFPMHKRVVTHYETGSDGVAELHLYYGDKQITFDEVDLFPFAETLASRPRFVAGTAASWGPGYRWPRVRELLEQLVEAGILQRAEATDVEDHGNAVGVRPSPLPPAPLSMPRSWSDCEAITRELTGRPLELGYLELVVPIFRVAHMAMDAEGRQVGESNVFPKALRVVVPTRWRACIYAGTRYQADRPMNVTALKSMRAHWAQMMKALLHVRAAYLARFPEVRGGWTVGHLERLSTAVLAVPTYQLMRTHGPVANGDLHPALSSLFRVTDGLRMTMHQMLFVPIGEPTLSPEAPMDVATILAYAERNYSFHSEHGVCAGPRAMIEEFLATLVDGHPAIDPATTRLDPAVQAALDDAEPAIDYALRGLQAYAAVFSLWPVMARAYEQLGTLVEAWSAAGAPAVIELRDRLRDHVESVRASTYLATEAWRVDRESVYADMHEQCAAGLGAVRRPGGFAALIAPKGDLVDGELRVRIVDALRTRFDAEGDANLPMMRGIAEILVRYCLQEQAILRAACEAQDHINALLGRARPKRAFGAAEIDIHNLLQGAEARRLPYLIDELEALFGLRVAIDKDRIALSHPLRPGAAAAHSSTESGRHWADRTACDPHALARRVS